MKYIFRTVLLNRFSPQPIVPREDLEEALIKAKYPRGDLDAIIQRWTLVVDEMVKSGQRQQDKMVALIRDTYQGPLQATQIKQVFAIWESQYQQVYSGKLKSVLPYNHLQSFNWCVNTKFMSKRMNKMNEQVAVLNLTLSEPQSSKQKTVTLEVDPVELQAFYKQLLSVQQRVDQLMNGQ